VSYKSYNIVQGYYSLHRIEAVKPFKKYYSYVPKVSGCPSMKASKKATKIRERGLNIGG